MIFSTITNFYYSERVILTIMMMIMMRWVAPGRGGWSGLEWDGKRGRR
jgi:hypothetical protein